ncbi:30S ribosomal protein S12 methylthiotransferase RimO [Campylobacter hepaticus]|uniref:Ribosomal protein uS12 methylthiotransferase RimO n=1 Tax=Campylobacter hepaticus TaxID=1813019 RepID=A0A424YYT7_9BACT|nr:30S ribosomal protein S12 methylthiotransferase RimO [Campylobacter hepaticus]AXP09045.1 30S ribosomal protein S12 methylthiotransferase RimO [Campylobacter hepaticus]MCZ0771907.1 30S ribosomal protein S12 methylthiotransferase RimO [Campylobacter hepaticus]MCZ0773376.1 30S ribosomal protein S12 methylthiotransferase RimO [Campylobacter hepaticus]MCZ0774627.1 30S ribosomal protein S12 methylthiotransferase RimO [Campylobacter hepaticus]MDX2323963.1 30S ribosomal protein S12 methylthiotransf
MPKLFLMSLGCNKNLVDSEIMLGRLSAYELCDEPSKADVLIINTCGFIHSAKQESINAILDLHNQRKKDSLLVVTGCLMQRYREELIKELPEVDLFTGVGDYERIDEMILKKTNLFSNSTYLQGENAKRIITGSNFHAFIKIAEGCNQKCSFCAIPNFKGRLKSREIASIITELKELVARGYKDFSFIAQDTSSYLFDKGQKDGLIRLIDEVEKVQGIEAARILYLYPTSISENLIKRIIDSKIFVNYFDMPLQHISNHMLKIMKRGVNQNKLKEMLSLMRSAPDSFLRTGFIVGHPGESDEDFKELCEFLKDFAFDRVSVFAYSKEEDTCAFYMEQVPFKVINQRLDVIEKLVDKCIEKSFEKEVGQKRLVICSGESSEGEFFIAGKDLRWDREIDGEILINESECGNLEIGQIYECEIIQNVDNKLIAKALRKIHAA